MDPSAFFKSLQSQYPLSSSYNGHPPSAGGHTQSPSAIPERSTLLLGSINPHADQTSRETVNNNGGGMHLGPSSSGTPQAEVNWKEWIYEDGDGSDTSHTTQSRETQLGNDTNSHQESKTANGDTKAGDDDAGTIRRQSDGSSESWPFNLAFQDTLKHDPNAEELSSFFSILHGFLNRAKPSVGSLDSVAMESASRAGRDDEREPANTNSSIPKTNPSAISQESSHEKKSVRFNSESKAFIYHPHLFDSNPPHSKEQTSNQGPFMELPVEEIMEKDLLGIDGEASSWPSRDDDEERKMLHLIFHPEWFEGNDYGLARYRPGFPPRVSTINKEDGGRNKGKGKEKVENEESMNSYLGSSSTTRKWNDSTGLNTTVDPSDFSSLSFRPVESVVDDFPPSASVLEASSKLREVTDLPPYFPSSQQSQNGIDVGQNASPVVSCRPSASQRRRCAGSFKPASTNDSEPSYSWEVPSRHSNDIIYADPNRKVAGTSSFQNPQPPFTSQVERPIRGQKRYYQEMDAPEEFLHEKYPPPSSRQAHRGPHNPPQASFATRGVYKTSQETSAVPSGLNQSWQAHLEQRVPSRSYHHQYPRDQRESKRARQSSQRFPSQMCRPPPPPPTDNSSMHSDSSSLILAPYSNKKYGFHSETSEMNPLRRESSKMGPLMYSNNTELVPATSSSRNRELGHRNLASKNYPSSGLHNAFVSDSSSAQTTRPTRTLAGQKSAVAVDRRLRPNKTWNGTDRSELTGRYPKPGDCISEHTSHQNERDDIQSASGRFSYPSSLSSSFPAGGSQLLSGSQNEPQSHPSARYNPNSRLHHHQITRPSVSRRPPDSRQSDHLQFGPPSLQGSFRSIQNAPSSVSTSQFPARRIPQPPPPKHAYPNNGPNDDDDSDIEILEDPLYSTGGSNRHSFNYK